MNIFTKEQQAEHCDQLALILKSKEPQQYDQSHFIEENWQCGTVACAFGWAAVHGVGGLRVFAETNPVLDQIKEASSNTWEWSRKSADVVFGDEAWNRIFAAENTNYEEVAEDPDVEGDLSVIVAEQDLHQAINALIDQSLRLRGIFPSK